MKTIQRTCDLATCPACLHRPEEERELMIKSKMPHFKVGDKVKLRGDMGGFRMRIIKIYNDWFCQCSYYGTKRHINMLFLEKRK